MSRSFTRESLTDSTATNRVRDDLVDLGSTLDLTLRCNAPAVRSGQLNLTFPSRADIGAYLLRSDALVTVARDDNGKLVGLMITTDDRGKRRGGGYIRWLVLAPMSEEDTVAATLEMSAEGVARFGWVWGRIGNPWLHAVLLRGLPDAAVLDDDPELLMRPRDVRRRA